MSPAERSIMEAAHAGSAPADLCSRTIDWYAEGQSRGVRIGDVEIEVRYVGRKGRRGRIAITAPAGASFCSE